MARKTVLVCDNCGAEVGEGKGATLRLNYTDARRGSKQADLVRQLRRPDARACRCETRAQAEDRCGGVTRFSRYFRTRPAAPVKAVGP